MGTRRGWEHLRAVVGLRETVSCIFMPFSCGFFASFNVILSSVYRGRLFFRGNAVTWILFIVSGREWLG